MDPESNLVVPPVIVRQQQQGHFSADVVVPTCGTPVCGPAAAVVLVTTSAATSASATTATPATTQDYPGAPPQLVTCDQLHPLVPYDDTRSQLTSLISEPPRTCCGTTEAAALLLTHSQHLGPQSMAYFACTDSPSSSSVTAIPAPAPTYPPRPGQHQQLLPAPDPVCSGYTGVSYIDDILRDGRVPRPGPWWVTRGVRAPGSELQQLGAGGRMGRAGVVLVRRWACTGVLLLVGALPWLIAMATFIRQRNSALAGLLGLVFVFFMAVVLGRLIKRAREAAWLTRQDRRRRQCIHHCSSQMLMSESPPAYEVVVKSPPPYSISFNSQSPSQLCHTSSGCYVTPPMSEQLHINTSTHWGTHLHDQTENNAQVPENLDTRITSVDDRADPSLPSYDEAVGGHWKYYDNN